MVEDAPNGLEAAHAAGCFTLAVVTTTPREDLHADAVVDDLSEVGFEPGPDGIRVRLEAGPRQKGDDSLGPPRGPPRGVQPVLRRKVRLVSTGPWAC